MTTPISKPLRQTCSRCNFAKLCLPLGLTIDDKTQLDTFIHPGRVINAQTSLFKIGDHFSHLIAVKSGAFKAELPSPSGQTQIIEFYLPGELLGFEAIHTGKYNLHYMALETSTICEIPFKDVLTYSARIPNLQRQIFNLISQALAGDFILRINNTAEQRLAAFFLNLSKRYKKSGFSALEFHLPMLREDIANYLRLAPETVSRMLTVFQNDGILNVERRLIKLWDLYRLQQRLGGN